MLQWVPWVKNGFDDILDFRLQVLLFLMLDNYIHHIYIIQMALIVVLVHALKGIQNLASD